MESDFSFSFETGSLSDFTPPLVAAVSPLNGASSVGTNTEIAIEFSEAMDISTLTRENLEVYEGSEKLSVTISYAGNIVLLKPSRTLVAGTSYTLNVKRTVQDSAGNPMSSDFTSNFTTGGGVDSTPPKVSAIFPSDGSVDIPITQKGVILIFSETLDPVSITKNSIQVQNSLSETISGSFVRIANTVVFYSSSNYEANVTYTIKVNKELKDLAGNSLEQESTFTFRTVSYQTSSSVPPPTFTTSSISSNLTNGQTGINPSSSISLNFPEAIDPASVNGNSITLVDSLGNAIAGTFVFTNNNLSVVFDPSVDLSPNTTYTLSALEGIKTLSGNRLSSTFTLSFTTGAISVAQYTIGGTVSGLVGSVTLQNNSTDTLTLTTNGNFTFSNALNSGSSYSVSILTQPSGQTCSVSNGSGSLTANVTNVTVSCINNVATTLPTASYPWGTFTDMGNGTVRFVGVAGVFGGQTYTADTLYFAKCSKDQTWDSVNNTCTGTVGQARYCSSANNSCNDSTTLQLNGTGTSQAWDYCNSLNLAGRSWRVPTKNELKLTIQCTNQTILSSDDGSSCASSPAINTNLFPNTATANCRYWTATASSSSNAWFINYCTGVAISNNNKDAFNYIRCVSTGP
ncbi:MAG: Ig-like domain-containing protein [Leptospiraceae bacterium]|nr:Ig-like domain-containing protein [Leptospiraceae bacterium]